MLVAFTDELEFDPLRPRIPPTLSLSARLPALRPAVAGDAPSARLFKPSLTLPPLAPTSSSLPIEPVTFSPSDPTSELVRLNTYDCASLSTRSSAGLSRRLLPELSEALVSVAVIGAPL